MPTFDVPSPLRIAVGSWMRGTGVGCAMNVLSYEQGDSKITDWPSCTSRTLTPLIQAINDSICPHIQKMKVMDREPNGQFAGVKSALTLCPKCSMKILHLAHLTVGTGGLTLEGEKVVLAAALLDLVLTYGPSESYLPGMLRDYISRPRNSRSRKYPMYDTGSFTSDGRKHPAMVNMLMHKVNDDSELEWAFMVERVLRGRNTHRTMLVEFIQATFPSEEFPQLSWYEAMEFFIRRFAAHSARLPVQEMVNA